MEEEQTQSLVDIETDLKMARDFYQTDDNLLVSVLLLDLAIVYDRLNRNDEALEKYQQAIDITEKIYGPEHPRSILLKYEFGKLLIKMDKSAEALVLIEEIIVKAIEQLGPSHSAVGDMYQTIGYVYKQHKVR